MPKHWRCILGLHDWTDWYTIVNDDGEAIEQFSDCRRLTCTAGRSVRVLRSAR